MKRILALACCVGLTGCMKGPAFMDQETQTKSERTAKGDKPASDDPKKGAVAQDSGLVSSSSAVAQSVEGSGGATAGASVTFPPGALAIDTTVSIVEAAKVASPGSTAELGIGDVEQQGAPVLFESSEPLDAVQPFQIAVPLPDSAGLTTLDEDVYEFLIVMYKVMNVKTGKTMLGFYTRDTIAINGGNAVVSSLYFGSFQAVLLKIKVPEAKQVEVSTPILSAQEVKDLPALSLTGRSVLVANAGQTVTLTGKNFRQSMILALGGKKVESLAVQSDTSATFVTPANGSFGLASFALDQDGVTASATLMYAGSSTDLPIITRPPADVCSGEQYYDQTGTKRTGTKNCSGGGGPAACTSNGQTNCVANASYKAADLTNLLASNVKSGVSIAGVQGSVVEASAPACSANLETNCVTNATYKAANLTNLSTGNIKSGVSIAGVMGNVVPAPAACSTDGGENCVANTNFPAAQKSGAAAKILAGQTVAGISGSYAPDFPDAANVRTTDTVDGSAGTLANCSSGNATGCVAVANYKSVDMAQLTEANLRRGFSLNGVTGTYPSATAPLERYVDNGTTNAVAGDGGVTTSLTNFATQLTGAGSFEFWDAHGIRRTGSGDADIVDANVKAGTSFENLSINGNAAIPDAWDVRVGVPVGASSGKLKVNCRNYANTTLFDMDTPKLAALNNTTDILTIANHGFAANDQVRIQYSNSAPGGLNNSTTYYVKYVSTNTIQLASTSGGAAINFTTDGTGVTVFRYGPPVALGLSPYDAIDDYNYAGSVLTTSPFGPANQCSGTESSFGDDNVWRDVTATGAPCNGTNCRFKDKISGLEWSKFATGKNWAEAIEYCENLTMDGQSDWRMPTQKELMSAYEHGVRSVNNSNFVPIATLAQDFWSATTYSNSLDLAFTIKPANGMMSSLTKTQSSSVHVFCVR